MNNRFNKLFLMPSLFIAMMLVQGCGDASPEINEENCSKIGNERTQFEFQKNYFKTENEWNEFKNQCEQKKLGQYKFLDYQDHKVNKENCDKLYTKENGFSEEYKKNFSSDLGWRRFADRCHSLDKSKPSAYKSWTPFGSDNPNAVISTQPEINKENCSKIYREDGSISKEYREQFRADYIWEMFADVCKANQL